MSTSDWIAFATLMLTILAVSGGGLYTITSKINDLTKSFEDTISAVRTAAYVEYKELRREMNALVAKTYLELGEAPRALREKIGQVELWMRDNLLPRKEYERDQDQILASLHKLAELIDSKFSSMEKKIDEERRSREPT